MYESEVGYLEHIIQSLFLDTMEVLGDHYYSGEVHDDEGKPLFLRMQNGTLRYSGECFMDVIGFFHGAPFKRMYIVGIVIALDTNHERPGYAWANPSPILHQHMYYDREVVDGEDCIVVEPVHGFDEDFCVLYKHFLETPGKRQMALSCAHRDPGGRLKVLLNLGKSCICLIMAPMFNQYIHS